MVEGVRVMRRAGVRSISVTVALALLAGCGGGGGGSGSAPVTVVTTPSPTPSPTPTPTPVATATPTPNPTPTAVATPFPAAPATPATWAAGVAAAYDVVPDVAGCRTGTLKAGVKADVLLRVNAVRALHGLSAVTYADADDEQTAQSSLMMAANQQLSHTPPTTWTCYTAGGATGAGSGNLFAGTGSAGAPWLSDDSIVASWMTEINSVSIGHRRWMLDPYLGKISYGRVARSLAGGGYYDAATLKVFNFTGGVAPPGVLPAYVGYPQGDYPARYMDAAAFLSFSVVGATRTASAAVRFATATVAVSAGGQALAVSSVSFDNDGYGVPNNIQWKVAGLQPNVTYTVRVTGVTGAPAADYTYTFRLVP